MRSFTPAAKRASLGHIAGELGTNRAAITTEGRRAMHATATRHDWAECDPGQSYYRYVCRRCGRSSRIRHQGQPCNPSAERAQLNRIVDIDYLRAELATMRAKLDRLTLDDRSWHVVLRRLNGDTFQAIANEEGVSREHIRKICAAAARRFRLART